MPTRQWAENSDSGAEEILEEIPEHVFLSLVLAATEKESGLTNTYKRFKSVIVAT